MTPPDPKANEQPATLEALMSQVLADAWASHWREVDEEYEAWQAALTRAVELEGGK